MRYSLLVLLLNFLVAGCAATLPEKSQIIPDYSLEGARTVSIETTCEQVDFSDVKQSFVEAYCDSCIRG